MTETITGQIQKVNFLNDESGFSIVSLKIDGSQQGVTAVGQLNFPTVGELVELTGEFKRHPRFGRQFEVDFCQTRPPENESGLRKYLGSGLIKGVGPILAARLVDTFGSVVLEVLDKAPERLTEVAGLGPIRREKIIEAWRSTVGLKQLLAFLSSFGLGPSLAAKILKRYGAGAEAAIREDPYRLSHEIFGVGFLTADKVAKSLGFAPDSPQRLEAGLLYCLDEAVKSGHDYIPSNILIANTAKLLTCNNQIELQAALAKISLAGRVMAEPQSEPGHLDIYHPQTHRAEVWVARAICSILSSPFAVGVPRPEKALAWAEQKLGLALSDDQKEAAQLAITSKCVIITGGPGTGKTTMTKAICDIWRVVTPKIALVAPTGRAAKRLSQATGFPASTIHRLLECTSRGGGFVHGPDNRLDLHMLLVDEASMIDIVLMNQLLGALPSHTALILVGDQDQLPPVGPGKVLSDLIESGLMPTKKLTKIYRQTDESLIITAAHMINEGKVPIGLSTSPDVDYHFVAEQEPEKIIDKILRLVSERIPRKLNLNPINDIMVLSPTRKGELGTVNLNNCLGKILNPQPNLSVARFGMVLKKGDRVMQIRNNYTRNVFNGDLGLVDSIDLEGQELQVAFDDKKASYDFTDLDELTPAWASTVHKAQGSEFPAVVIPIHTSHSIMLRRKLIYTAVTRGRQMVFLVGSPEALRDAVHNNKENARFSHLIDRLMDFKKGRN
ncbi:MAG: ATP-dependent RecD-like DNA helicase [Deltaproteobacteria bacterium]|nr:ATP-dependent RecD-like DNA helicase [Deltaproteobacteria bacterium]